MTVASPPAPDVVTRTWSGPLEQLYLELRHHAFRFPGQYQVAVLEDGTTVSMRTIPGNWPRREIHVKHGDLARAMAIAKVFKVDGWQRMPAPATVTLHLVELYPSERSVRWTACADCGVPLVADTAFPIDRCTPCGVKAGQREIARRQELNLFEPGDARE